MTNNLRERIYSTIQKHGKQLYQTYDADCTALTNKIMLVVKKKRTLKKPLPKPPREKK